jgi:hypothetical protein
MVLAFDLFVGAGTADTANGADNAKWGEAMAHWSFNGSGAVEGAALEREPGGCHLLHKVGLG